MKKVFTKKFIAALVGVSLLVVAIIVGITMMKGDGSGVSSSGSTSSHSSGGVAPVKEGDTQAPVDAATKLLQAAVPSGDLRTTVDNISKGDYSGFNKEEVDKLVVFSGTFKDDETMHRQVYQVIVALAGTAAEKNDGQVVPDALAAGYVFLDDTTGDAFVPAGVFLGNASSRAANLHMVKVDGQWKLLPYTVVSEIGTAAKGN